MAKKSVEVQIAGLVLFATACFAVAGIGSTWTIPSIDPWYLQLQKPQWTPPAWVFGPVWTVLYAMMALAAWLVWREHGFREARVAMGLFVVQLLLNAAWSGLFFGLRSPAAGMLNILLLWPAILATIIAFWQKSSWAALLMLPYFAWVSFALVLNGAIWQMN